MPTNYTAPFLLVRRDGKTWERESLIEIRALCYDLNIIRHRAYWMTDDMFVGPLNMIGISHFDGVRAFQWTVSDLNGRPVPPREVWTAGETPDIRERDRAQQHAASLGLPIPFTARRRWNRRIKRAHIAAYRASAEMKGVDRYDEDFEVAPASGIDRWSRKDGLPPNPWDYECRSRQPTRNWKEYRRTRWRR